MIVYIKKLKDTNLTPFVTIGPAKSDGVMLVFFLTTSLLVSGYIIALNVIIR